jgi:hypothetical protein
MRHNNTPAAATQINNLIALAQSAPNEDARASAIGQMWEQYGDKIVGIAAKQSYTMDSDFGYHGYSVAERRSAVMSETFEVFRKTALEFDATLGVPFMAHAANKVKWQLQTNKRENAKKTDREVSLDYIENCSAPNDMEANVYLKDAIAAIKRSLASNPTLLRYFDTLLEISLDGLNPTDAEAARYMGCTRATTNNYHKQLLEHLDDYNLVEDCRMALAA